MSKQNVAEALESVTQELSGLDGQYDSVIELLLDKEIESRVLMLASEGLRKALGEQPVLPESSTLRSDWEEGYPVLCKVVDRVIQLALSDLKEQPKATSTSAA